MRRTRLPAIALPVFLVAIFGPFRGHAQDDPDARAGTTDVREEGRSYIFTNDDGEKIRVTPYGHSIVRIQNAPRERPFLDDSRYRMVAGHDWPGELTLTEGRDAYRLTGDRLDVVIQKPNLTVSFHSKSDDERVLAERYSIRREGTEISKAFRYDSSEHFAGLGHTFKGRQTALDLQGRTVERNYGRPEDDVTQAPLIVPFYLSSKGYGIFLNSTFPNRFNFGHEEEYTLTLDDKGHNAQLDYFFMYGPGLKEVLDLYTQLTGRPRLPQLSIFGLQLSDKVNDHTHENPSDMEWWKRKIRSHREAGLPFDHIVNDNRWRAGAGKRCDSALDWSEERYPDPAAFKSWTDSTQVTVTIDFNRCIAPESEGWSPAMNMVDTLDVPYEEADGEADPNPDLTDPDVRGWFWDLMYRNVFDPELDYPGDAIWVDEFDALTPMPLQATMANGWSWAETANYYFFLVAQALVDEGWDADIAQRKRPYVWVRGMTAGAQRYATLWSGDIGTNFGEMKHQIRAMQSAGLSGFPYWGHDAGGFVDLDDWDNPNAPNDTLYAQWSIAFGSVAPIWKPHGRGKSRWPTDRSSAIEPVIRRYMRLRYTLMPYTYTLAHTAHRTGVPMARPMLLEYPEQPNAWKRDLQYMWGDQMLVAPPYRASGSLEVWLPPGKWYNYWNDRPVSGGRMRTEDLELGEMPIYVKAGSIIPKYDYAQSTLAYDKGHLHLHVYAGAEGDFTLIEDDGVSERYRTEDAVVETGFRLTQQDDRRRFHIGGGTGHYEGAPEERTYTIYVHGLAEKKDVGERDFIERTSWERRDGGSLTLTIETEPVDYKKALQVTWHE